MTITIDNRDTENIHIDTYQMLTGESASESELGYYNDENKKDLSYDDFDWTYDHKQIVKDFADISIMIVFDNINKDIVKKIELKKTLSPRFYNYTTDGYVMDVDVDEKALNDYIAKNKLVIGIKANQYDASIMDGVTSFTSMQHAALCHLLDHTITADDYNMALWEKENEVYYENTTMKLIEKS